MDHTEHLLTKLAEECMEVAQRCHKAQIFGLNEIEPGQMLTNAERIIQESIDLFGVFEMCYKDAELFPEFSEDHMMKGIEAKKAKVLKYMEYSREKGCLK